MKIISPLWAGCIFVSDYIYLSLHDSRRTLPCFLTRIHAVIPVECFIRTSSSRAAQAFPENKRNPEKLEKSNYTCIRLVQYVFTSTVVILRCLWFVWCDDIITTTTKMWDFRSTIFPQLLPHGSHDSLCLLAILSVVAVRCLQLVGFCFCSRSHTNTPLDERMERRRAENPSVIGRFILVPHIVCYGWQERELLEPPASDDLYSRVLESYSRDGLTMG